MFGFLKNKLWGFLGISVLVLGLVLIRASISQDTPSGKGLVTFVEGDAKKQRLEEAMWTLLAQYSPVAGGERVRTFVESRAELELVKLDRIRMAPQTTIDILKLYDETKESAQEAKIILQKGDLWANVSKKPANMSFSIGTPVAAAAITGTVLRVNVAQDSTSELKVYKGEVVLSNAPENKRLQPKSIAPYQIEGPHQIEGPREVSMEEWALIVKSMQKVKVNKQGQITYSGQFATTDSDEQSDWVRWNQRMDQRNR